MEGGLEREGSLVGGVGCGLGGYPLFAPLPYAYEREGLLPLAAPAQPSPLASQTSPFGHHHNPFGETSPFGGQSFGEVGAGAGWAEGWGASETGLPAVGPQEGGAGQWGAAERPASAAKAASEGGGKRRRQRVNANPKERRRNENINQAFRALQSRIPSVPGPTTQALPKIKTLRLAMEYIRRLRAELEAPAQRPSIAELYEASVSRELQARYSYKDRALQLLAQPQPDHLPHQPDHAHLHPQPPTPSPPRLS